MHTLKSHMLSSSRLPMFAAADVPATNGNGKPMKLVAHDAVEGFAEGASLDTQQQAIDYFRRLLQEGAEDGGDPITVARISDETLWELIASVKGNSPKANAQRFTKMLEVLDAGRDDDDDGSDIDELVPGLTSSGKLQSAIDAAKKMDKKFCAILESQIKIREDAKRTPVVVYFAAINTWSKDVINTWPEYGSLRKETTPDGQVIRRNVFDRYQRKVIINGKNRFVWASFYRDLFDSSELGVALYKSLEQINACLATEQRGGLDVPANLKSMTDRELIAEKRRVADRVKNGPILLGTAAKTCQQLIKFKELEPKVMCAWIAAPGMEANAETGDGVTASQTCLWLGNPNDATKNESSVVTLSQFLLYDVDEAIRKGGTYRALLNTTSRDSETPKSKVAPIKNIGDVQGYVAELAAYFTGNGVNAVAVDHYTETVKALGAKDGAPFIRSFGDLLAKMQAAFAPYETKYSTLVRKDANEAAEKDAA